MRGHRAQRAGQWAKAAGKTAAVHMPKLPIIVPGIVEHESVELETIAPGEDAPELPCAAQQLGFSHFPFRHVEPGVVEQIRAHWRYADARHVSHEPGMHGPRRRDADDRRLGAIAAAADIDAHDPP